MAAAPEPLTAAAISALSTWAAWSKLISCDRRLRTCSGPASSSLRQGGVQRLPAGAGPAACQCCPARRVAAWQGGSLPSASGQNRSSPLACSRAEPNRRRSHPDLRPQHQRHVAARQQARIGLFLFPPPQLPVQPQACIPPGRTASTRLGCMPTAACHLMVAAAAAAVVAAVGRHTGRGYQQGRTGPPQSRGALTWTSTAAVPRWSPDVAM